jgi:hypothetical protein
MIVRNWKSAHSWHAREMGAAQWGWHGRLTDSQPFCPGRVRESSRVSTKPPFRTRRQVLMGQSLSSGNGLPNDRRQVPRPKLFEMSRFRMD